MFTDAAASSQMPSSENLSHVCGLQFIPLRFQIETPPPFFGFYKMMRQADSCGYLYFQSDNFLVHVQIDTEYLDFHCPRKPQAPPSYFSIP